MRDLPADVTDPECAEGIGDQLDDLLLDIAWTFLRVDLWRRPVACVRGLPAPLSRKNGWQISEYVGEATPWGQQHGPFTASVDTSRHRVADAPAVLAYLTGRSDARA
ncbi:hypothetical protein [Streptomyces sp. NPDC056628]|uniref:hypothetical protein n=1 Tax=Streptomyces sp. NPDC056628 TaxID=3345882 RepID=UPI0036B148AC